MYKHAFEIKYFLFISYILASRTCMNIGRYLLERHPEHEVYFLVSDKYATKIQEWEPKFKPLVYLRDEESFNKTIEKYNEREKAEGKKNEIKDCKNGDTLFKLIEMSGDNWQKPLLDQFESSFPEFYKNLSDIFYEKRSKIEEIIDELKPDVIAFDHIVMVPYLCKDRKWIQIMTMNPLFMDHVDLPPYSSGLSCKKEIAFEEWKRFRLAHVKLLNEPLLIQNIRLTNEGQTCIRPPNRIIESPYFNVYIYPKEIDYYSESEKIKLPGRWIRMDSSIIPTKKIKLLDLNDREGRFKLLKQLLTVPDDFLNPDSKLIFFSLGSMASAYIKIMNRLLDFIGNLKKYRFVVSKGPSGEKLKLPDNCIGENFVNQFEILKICDLMISHGGNNTLTEAFHVGVPLLLLPLFSDQPDNAQRLVDLNMGYALNPFTCTQEEFTRTVNNALDNKELTEKMQKLSKRVQIDNGMTRTIEEIHNLIIT